MASIAISLSIDENDYDTLKSEGKKINLETKSYIRLVLAERAEQIRIKEEDK